MKLDYTCTNEECNHDFIVKYTPLTPDKYMFSRFEDAIQGSGAEVDPCECPKCGEEVDIEKVAEDAGE